MKKSLIRLAASVVLSALLVVGISASGILTNGHRTDGLFYQASGIRPDAELLAVNGENIDAEEYLYWLAYDCEYLAYNVQDLDFDAELSDGMTYGAYVRQDALETVKLYSVVRAWAEEAGVTLTEEDQAALDAQRLEYVTYYGSEEAYQQQLEAQGIAEIRFVTKGAQSAFTLADLLASGTGSFTLTHEAETVSFTLVEKDISGILK